MKKILFTTISTLIICLSLNTHTTEYETLLDTLTPDFITESVSKISNELQTLPTTESLVMCLKEFRKNLQDTEKINQEKITEILQELSSTQNSLLNIYVIKAADSGIQLFNTLHTWTLLINNRIDNQQILPSDEEIKAYHALLAQIDIIVQAILTRLQRILIAHTMQCLCKFTDQATDFSDIQKNLYKIHDILQTLSHALHQEVALLTNKTQCTSTPYFSKTDIDEFYEITAYVGIWTLVDIAAQFFGIVKPTVNDALTKIKNN